ncbi:MAG: serine/threonine protein kinase [Candidatus Melainabacteria bacterium]|nr:serine/threonine protein kinase [Candidatus Melainabacteria bacterium]
MGSDEVVSPTKMRCMRCQEEFSDGRQICPHDGTRLIVALPDPMIGKTFADRYEIISVVGRGGMSVVYKAQQMFMQNYVAIKVLNQTLISDPSSFDRFKQEAIAAISIRDENVIQVLDFGISDDKAFLIMEYLEGQDLADWLIKNGDMPVERALKIFTQACSGLAHAHAKGVIHRDLKPGNLFLINEPDGHELVKIVDFGIAKIQSKDGAIAQNLTQPGEVFGSPLYMSPEQCQGKSLDARSDIYSLGCVLYEALTGMPPLMGINSFETMNKHVGEQPLSLREMMPEKDIPELLEACILKSLQKDPDQRQQTMLQFKQELIESVKDSRIYLGDDKDRAAKAISIDAAGQGTEAVVDETGAKATEALHQLVLDAVDLTKKQDEHNKRLRHMVLILYALLGSLVMGLVWWATKPGPASDPAPLYKQEPYRWKIAEAESDLREGKFNQALEAYKTAVAMSKDFGPGTEKRTKALFGLLVCLERTGASPELITSARHELLNANIKHMEYIYGHDGHDLAQMIDMDAGLLQRVGGNNVDRSYAESLAKNYVADAKSDFAKKNYLKALSWLQEALEIEEQTHCNAGVAETAAAFQSAADGKEHIDEIKKLLERATAAEMSETTRDAQRARDLNQPKSTLE